MAIGLPFHDPSWSPADAFPEATPRAAGRPDVGPEASPEGTRVLDLARAVIEDGLLMVFGPDGDPIPPEVFRAAAAGHPHAGIPLQDGPRVPAERIAAVLEAQTGSRLGSGGDGGDAWIQAMLGVGPRPEMAESKDLLAEDCTVEVIAFGKELLITSRGGGTFLVTEARLRHPESICLRVAQEGPIALGQLVARLLASPGGYRSDDASAHRDEFAASDCRAWIEGDGLVIDLPRVGQVHLARSIGAVSDGALAGVFTSGGETATIDDLARALDQPAELPTATGCDAVLTPVDAAPTRSVPLNLGLPDALAGPDGAALVVLRGVPKAARLSAGVESGDGDWLLSPRDLAGLSLTPPPGPMADLPLNVVAISVAGRDGDLTSASNTVVVPLRSEAIEVAPAPIPLGLDPQALGGSGPFDAIIVLDVPAGAALSAGTYDPAIDAWVLLPRQLAQLSVLPASGNNQDFTLSLLGVCLQPGSREGPRLLARVPVTVR